jgi:hypothetical protein
MIDYILLKEGDVIHANIWKSLIETYKSHIKENCVYSMTSFKVQQTTVYRYINNDLKRVFMYNTNLKALKTTLNKYPSYHFDFTTKDILLERENKVIQCSRNISYIYIFKFSQFFLFVQCVIF